MGWLLFSFSLSMASSYEDRLSKTGSSLAFPDPESPPWLFISLHDLVIVVVKAPVINCGACQ